MPAQAFSDKSTVLMLLTGAGLTTTTGEDKLERSYHPNPNILNVCGQN